MVVGVSITHTATIENHGVIKQVTVSIWRRLELIQKITQQTDMIAIQQGKPGLVVFIVGMMGKGMKSIPYATAG